MWGGRAKVFKWVPAEDNPSFLLRTKVDSHDAEEEYRHYTKNQRHYWAHCNHWDLNEYLPRYPDGTRKEDMNEHDSDEVDDGYDSRPVFVYDPLPPAERLQRPEDTFANAGAKTIMRNLVDTVSATVSTNPYAPVQLSLAQYLRQRHGFTVSTAPTNYTVLHDSTHNSTVALDKPWQVGICGRLQQHGHRRAGEGSFRLHSPSELVGHKPTPQRRPSTPPSS
ncbi:hypothetical protein NLJ89_g12383 [Agrocybe chaxingu]|uniref:Uncharacterized protein n=1 Tax=Agrocybe chaxingu TaxID=84603 RepID=A0A9W8JK38_9AGAR|nr:hypothetical protein NLJ89_g12383 [Agrocybe chaxingu]